MQYIYYILLGSRLDINPKSKSNMSISVVGLDFMYRFD